MTIVATEISCKQKQSIAFGGCDIGYIAMLYADESVLRLQAMATAEKLLEDELAKRGIEWTAFGEQMGYKYGYQAVHAWINGKRQFTAELQERAAKLLGLPKNYFQQPSKAAAREQYINETFQRFMATQVAEDCDPDTLYTLKRMPFLGQKLPTVALYQAIALALQGQAHLVTDEQIDAAAEMNAKLDAEAEKVKHDLFPREETRKSTKLSKPKTVKSKVR